MSVVAWLRGPRKDDRAIARPREELGRILQDEARLEKIRTAKNLLSDLAPEESHRLVDGVARHFLSYVLDLPAAESYHHARAFGLLDHSLEVAEFALRSALTHYFVCDTQAYPERQVHLLPRIRYAAWFFGLLHDVGKILEVEVRAPDETCWNPFEETLADFAGRHGRERCLLVWEKGRGLNAHVWHSAYFTGLLLGPAVARYLGRRLVREYLAQRSLAAKEVLRLIHEADRRSTGADVRQQAQAAHEARSEGGSVPLHVAVKDYLEKVPVALSNAILKGVLRLNVLGGEVFAGHRWILLRYPEALIGLVPLLQEEVGRECAAVRALEPNQRGAHDLAEALHRERLLFADPAIDTWKVKATIEQRGAHAVVNGILVDRAFLEPALGTLGDLQDFPGELFFVRASDEKSLSIEGFKVPLPLPSLPPAPALPPSPLAPASAPAARAELRRIVSPKVLIEDIRQAILDRTIGSNKLRQPCFVLRDVTYLASPIGFQILVDKGLYDRDPSAELNVYLNALAKVPCVRKLPGGRVLTAVSVRPGANPLRVVAFDTAGLFRDQAELAQLRFWTESPIRELSDDEVRAAQAARAASASDDDPEEADA